MPLITNDYEAFLFIENHLLTQNAKAMNDSEDCQYRGYSDVTLNAVREEASLLAREQVEDYVEIDDSAFDLFYDILPTKSCDAMCAVGCLILDQFYDESMEGSAIEPNEEVLDAVVKSNPAWKITEQSFIMLKKLQQIHDGMPVKDWETALAIISQNFDQYNDYDQNKGKE